MSEEQRTEKEELKPTPDFTDSVTVLLLLAGLLSSLLIIAGRTESWNQTVITDFSALLTASSLVALTNALILKLFNPALQSVGCMTSLIFAYILLILSMFSVCFVLYITVSSQWGAVAAVQLNITLVTQIFIIASVCYLVVLKILLERAKNRGIKESFETANLQALQSRIRPHFMFNSMNSIAGLIRNNPERAELALQDLADLIRVLMADARKLVPLTAEIETCKQYLKVEKLRLGDRLSVQWHLNKIPKSCFVPSLILQPLLENAVYHGIEPSFGGGIIDIDMRADRNRVQILIRNPLPDDGKRNHRKGNQIAMDNIKQRLIRHFGDEASLSHTQRNTIHITKIIFPIVTNR